MGVAGGRLKFWDSSALLVLAARDRSSERVEALLRRDPDVAFWWGSPLTCLSLLADARRRNRLTELGFDHSRAVLDHLRSRSFEVQPTPEVRAQASRLIALHPLEADQSLELAAALAWCGERPRGMGFVSLDSPLRLAAALEGFRVLPYADEVHEPGPEGTAVAAFRYPGKEDP